MSYCFDRAAIYVIHVSGVVDPAWLDRLGGLRIIESGSTADGRTPVTKLIGELPDQAALVGVLNTLYENQHALLLVNQLDLAWRGQQL